MSNLKKIREEKNITQAKLAETSGVNLQMIQKYEQGVKDINKAQGITLYKIARALDCNMSELLENPTFDEIIKIVDSEEDLKRTEHNLKVVKESRKKSDDY